MQGVVGYELDLWGQYQRASESARAQLLNTEFGREATKLSLTGEVARGYFGLIAAAEQLARGRDTLATREESLRLEKLRFDAGESDEFTFKRAEADAAATRVSMHQLELEVVERTNALGMLLGRSPQGPGRSRDLGAGRRALPDAVTLPAALPSSVLERRPDIGAAEASLECVGCRHRRRARRACSRSISLTGAFGSVSTGAGRSVHRAGGSVVCVRRHPAAALPGRATARERRADQGGSRAAQGRVRADRAVAFREVLDALQGQALIAGVRDANAEQVAALARATELAELRYAQGDIAYIELARRASRPVPGADRPGRGAARRVAEHGRPGARRRRRARRQGGAA